MNQFADERLPQDIEAGAQIGPVFMTTIVGTTSGAETRNVEWLQERLKANLSYGIMDKDDPDDIENSYLRIVSFFRARLGRAIPFRFRDPSDFEAVNEPLAPLTPDGSTWQLVKNYGNSYRRKITRPDINTLKLYDNQGVEYTRAGRDPLPGWTVYDKGVVFFTMGVEQPRPPQLYASYEFDVPVRFDMDELTVSLTHIRAGDVPDITIVQVAE